ncbi:DUF5675 family protein [uncultured Helicobacter sp.]|uniref:DUF5675 family protein n=1 Tax=uncultured Helicobacter sp. TaxID=175537 RepID=UPI0026160D8F|nr:DUF5675 family protein [uncultured Helicobacter sp.]
MTYKIILQRKSEHKNIQKPTNPKIEDSTIGELKVINEDGSSLYKCFTCENIGPSTDTPNQDKRIMPRTYSLEWTDSSKNASLAHSYPQYKLPNGRNRAIWVTCDKELPSFRNRRILIHVGNYPQDTEGCRLLGKAHSGKGTITGSVEACKEFFDLLEKIGIENCTLEIIEI